MKYIIISPVRNEEQYIEKTIQSVINQTVRPMEWIIVNDGSADNTKSIVKNYANEHSWIRLVDRKDRGFTQVGKGVIEAFNEGFKIVNCKDWNYIVKLDCDLSLENDFFGELLYGFKENKKLGIAGGTSYVLEKGKLYEEKMPEFHPCAAARMYKKKCFADINGLIETLGWDTIDLLRAQMHGWQTNRFNDLKIMHHRRMSSRKGLWEGKTRTGRNFYITGYNPLFLIARSIYHLFKKPYFIETFGVIYGYLRAIWKQEPLVVSQNEKNYLQHQQLNRLQEKLKLIKKNFK
jgi:poly-beta-1,6-N-acetyl-D-glucosamine synthase